LQQIYEAGNVQVIVYISRKNKPVNLCIACAQPAGKHPNNHMCNEKVRKDLPERLAQFEGNTHVDRLWAWLRRNPDRPNYAAHPSQVEGVTPVAPGPENTSEAVEDMTMDLVAMDLEERVDVEGQVNMEDAEDEEEPLVESLNKMSLLQTEQMS